MELNKEILELKKKELNKACVVLNITRNKLFVSKTNAVIEKNLYVFSITDFNGKREVIDYVITKEEDSTFWINRLKEIKARGLDKVLYGTIPNVTSLISAIRVAFPKIEIFPSTIDMTNKIRKFISSGWDAVIYKEIRKIYTYETKEEYKEAYKRIMDIYKDNKIMLLFVQDDIRKIEKYYKYSANMRKIIFNYYPTRRYDFAIREKIKTSKNIVDENKFINECSDIFNYLTNGYCRKKQEFVELIEELYEIHGEEILEYFREM